MTSFQIMLDLMAALYGWEYCIFHSKSMEISVDIQI